MTILCGFFLWIQYILTPPKHLASIPALPLWKFVWAQVRSYTFDEQLVTRLYPPIPQIGNRVLTEDMELSVNKEPLFEKQPHLLFSYLLGKNIVTLPTGDEWRAHRQLANPPFKRSFDLTIFGNSALELFKNIERDQAASPDGTKTAIPMNSYMQQLTLDMLGKALFGYDFQALTKPGGEMVARYNSIVRQLFNPLYFVFPWMEKVFPRRQVQTRMDLIQHLILGTEDKVDAQGNVVEKAVMDMKTLRASFFVYTLAGHDTTSNALSSALFLIAKNPHVQDKLRAEIEAVLGGTELDTIPTHEDLKQMPYLFAVIKEVTRLYPPIPQIGSRILTEDMEMTPGVVFPKGTNVGINVRLIHKSKHVWGPDALEFKPERFLDDDGTTSSKLVASSWIPFGGGVRQCLGMGMSLLEQKVVLSMMLRRYKLHLPSPSTKPKVNIRGFLVISNADIIFEPRFATKA
ncbi:cytochrome P450 [Ramicandelaber brevisporus]|nr:cytochrome P450 [Ramicandelaber brevisporus]